MYSTKWCNLFSRYMLICQSFHLIKMAPTLYMIPASPPVRAVCMCAKAIGLELNLKNVDLLSGEHLKPEYLKINPQHTVPLLDDGGFILADSHAIMTYLVSKYGKDKSLYPTDLQQRAIVDHRLHFDSGILFTRGVVISRGVLFEGIKQIPQHLLDKLSEAFDMVEKFLHSNKYIAGNQLTIADFSFVTTITSWSLFLPLTEVKYPKMMSWLKKMEALPYYNENQNGLEQFNEFMKAKLQK